MGDKILDDYLSRFGEPWKVPKRLRGSSDPIVQPKDRWATTNPEDIPQKVDRTIKVIGQRPPINWLRPMAEGTVFHCRLISCPPFTSDWICEEYIVLAQYGRTTKLRAIEDLIVDNALFSDSYHLLQTL